MVKLIYVGVILATLSVAAADCKNEYTENDMYECLSQNYKEADKELNAIYKKMMPVIDKALTNKDNSTVKPFAYYFKQNQLAWIKMRDTTCDLETYESMTGTGYGSIYKACLLEKTQERINYIKNLPY